MTWETGLLNLNLQTCNETGDITFTHIGANMSYGTTKHKSYLSCLATNKDWSDRAHGMKQWMTGRLVAMRNLILQIQLLTRLLLISFLLGGLCQSTDTVGAITGNVKTFIWWFARDWIQLWESVASCKADWVQTSVSRTPRSSSKAPSYNTRCSPSLSLKQNGTRVMPSSLTWCSLLSMW